MHRWIKRYKLQGDIRRKTRKNHNLKITPEIENFVKEQVKRDPTTTLWEYSKLVNDEFNVILTDRSINNILNRMKITRKRLRSKYYPEKREGQEKQDLVEFYNKLDDYDKKTPVLDVDPRGGFTLNRKRELNIGHSIVSRAIFVGLRQAVSEMKDILSRFY